MWLRALVLPIVWLFSIAATIARYIGRILPAANLHSCLFNYLVGGRKNACKVRDELITRAEEHLMESRTNIEKSPEELVTLIENSRKRANTTISSGEFVLALLFGIAGFYISEWFTFGISVVIALSASLRITAVDSLAISSPDSTRSAEWLMAAWGWNRGAIEGGRILFNTASAVGIREYDERAFQAFVEEVFVLSLEQGGISMKQALRGFMPIIWEIVNSKGE